MKKNRIIVYDEDEKILHDFECRSFLITAETNIEGNLKYIRNLNSGKFDKNKWIMNYRYRPIAEQLVRKFKELKHILPEEILFLEDTEWEPTPAAKQPWIARIKKANKQLTAATGYEYVFEARHYYTGDMGAAKITALVYHELRHIDKEGDIIRHDIENWSNMVATLGHDWATTMADIPNILDKDFPGWRELPGRAHQLNMFAVSGGR